MRLYTVKMNDSHRLLLKQLGEQRRTLRSAALRDLACETNPNMVNPDLGRTAGQIAVSFHCPQLDIPKQFKSASHYFRALLEQNAGEIGLILVEGKTKTVRLNKESSMCLVFAKTQLGFSEQDAMVRAAELGAAYPPAKEKLGAKTAVFGEVSFTLPWALSKVQSSQIRAGLKLLAIDRFADRTVPSEKRIKLDERAQWAIASIQRVWPDLTAADVIRDAAELGATIHPSYFRPIGENVKIFDWDCPAALSEVSSEAIRAGIKQLAYNVQQKLKELAL